MSEQRQPPFIPWPLLPGGDEITEGYYELEFLERAQAAETLVDLRTPTELWYRGLVLYRRGLLGPRIHWHDIPEHVPSLNIRIRLLTLGVTTTKAALDMLLVGYYSMAYAAIRHMFESAVQISYLGVKPEMAHRWPGLIREMDLGTSPPNHIALKLVNLLLPFAMNSQEAAKQLPLYKAWELMCKGAHPSMEGARQLEAEKDHQLVLGATYHPELAHLGFEKGLYAMRTLLRLLALTVEQTDEWMQGMQALKEESIQWSKSLAPLVVDGEWAGSLPGPIVGDE